MTDLGRALVYRVSFSGSHDRAPSSITFPTIEEACAWVVLNCKFIEVIITPINKDAQ